jgi:hypothetical protein
MKRKMFQSQTTVSNRPQGRKNRMFMPLAVFITREVLVVSLVGLDAECKALQVQFDTIPFQGMNEIQIVKLVSRGKRPPRIDKPPLSDKAWKLIKRCWAKEAARRPAMEDIMERMMTWRSA